MSTIKELEKVIEDLEVKLDGAVEKVASLEKAVEELKNAPAPKAAPASGGRDPRVDGLVGVVEAIKSRLGGF